MRVPLLSASYEARSLKAAAQRCVNLFAETNPSDSPAPMTFYSVPGKRVWSTVPGTGPVRLLFRASNGKLFAVRGSGLYRYNVGTWKSLATLSTATGPVSADDNSLFAVFVDGTLYAPAIKLDDDTLTQMSGDGWYGADFVACVDSFLVFNRPATQQYYITGSLTLQLDPLDFASAEAMPDAILSFIEDHQELWFFGDGSTEIHRNTGGADFPFQRIEAIPVGCAAKFSPAKIDNSIAWLAQDERGDCMVMRAQGYSPARISTHALETEFRKYGTISDAFAYSYQQDGHAFYVLTFPTEGKTWAWDAATGLWAERAYRNSANTLTRDRANCFAFYERMHLVGDFENGNIYILDPEHYTDNGEVIARIKSFQHMVTDDKRQFFRELTLDMETGVGNAEESDPQVWLRYSDDGGNTWSATVTKSLGKAGEYAKRVNFNRLGMARDRIFEVQTTAKSKVVLQGAFIEMGA